MKSLANVKINNITFESLNSIKFTQGVNEHSSMHISGYINNRERESHYLNVGSDIIVSVDNSFSFAGIVMELSITSENESILVELMANSYSILLDIEKKKVSFQDKKMSYATIIEGCFKKYNKVDFLGFAQALQNSTNQLYLQCLETDWEFIMRLASAINEPIFCDSGISTTNISIGVPYKKSVVIEYNGSINEQYSNGNKFYKVSSNKYYPLGSCTHFLNQDLYISNIYTESRNEELLHNFILSPISSVPNPSHIYNENISGLLLNGIVESVKRDIVKVRLDIDGKQGLYWFTFSSVYSSKHGGWYAMPEIGDKVKVLFPDENEKNAYVSGMAYDENAKFRNNPEIKRMRNPSGNEIIFAPNYTMIKTANGNSYVKLNNSGNISLFSENDITMNSGESINISAGNNLVLDSKTAVVLRQQDNLISVSKDVVLKGENVKML